LIFALSFLVFSVGIVNAYYFGEEVSVIDPAYHSVNQMHPSLSFDSHGNLHFVWTDMRSDAGVFPPYIYHRYLDDSGFFSTSKRMMGAGDCDSQNCGPDFAEISFGFDDLNAGLAMAPMAVDYSIRGAQLDIAADTWSDIASLIPAADSQGNIALTSTPGIENYMFLANSDYDTISRAIKLERYNTTASEWDQYIYFVPTSSNIDLKYVDIGSDSDGYVYAVMEAWVDDLPLVILSGRTENPNNLDTWGEFREVSVYSETGQPAMAVRNFETDVETAFVWIDGQRIYCRWEQNGDWISSTQVGGTLGLVSASGGSPVNPDVVFGNYGEIYVVWQDQRTGGNLIYMSVSYDQGQTFSDDQLISEKNSYEATYPRITHDPATDSIAVVYQRADTARNTHIYCRYNIADLYDSCANFDHWDAVVGSYVTDVESHDPDGFSFGFSDTECSISQSYSKTFHTGSCDFYFFDSESTEADFYCTLTGTDGQVKAGVFRMLGARNEVSEANYSFNVNGVWQDTGRARTLGWHHVIMNVTHDGIETLLDPELDRTPIADDDSHLLIGFSSINFSGGADGVLDAYYLDDVRITLDTTECLKTGDMDGSGIVSAGDAQMAFMLSIGIFEPTYRQECAADCNSDGDVTAGDAQTIFAAAIGRDSCSDNL